MRKVNPFATPEASAQHSEKSPSRNKGQAKTSASKQGQAAVGAAAVPEDQNTIRLRNRGTQRLETLPASSKQFLSENWSIPDKPLQIGKLLDITEGRRGDRAFKLGEISTVTIQGIRARVDRNEVLEMLFTIDERLRDANPPISDCTLQDKVLGDINGKMSDRTTYRIQALPISQRMLDFFAGRIQLDGIPEDIYFEKCVEPALAMTFIKSD
jgi:hypothetical protein